MVIDLKMGGCFSRVQVELDLSKPLLRGVAFKTDSGSMFLTFKYERLLHFCYNCGKLGHTDWDCEEDVNNGLINQFGDFVPASPTNSIIRQDALENRHSSARRQLNAGSYDSAATSSTVQGRKDQLAGVVVSPFKQLIKVAQPSSIQSLEKKDPLTESVPILPLQRVAVEGSKHITPIEMGTQASQVQQELVEVHVTSQTRSATWKRQMKSTGKVGRPRRVDEQDKQTPILGKKKRSSGLYD